MKKKTINVQSEGETKILAESFIEYVQNGAIILLYGDLGSGKTTFVQHIAKALGIEKPVLSPTFPIIKQYVILSRFDKLTVNSAKELDSSAKPQNDIRIFYHIDLYRMETEQDVQNIGIQDILTEPNAIIAIEWAEKLGSLLPKKRWDIHFEYVDEFKRKITIEKFEARNPKSETNSNV